MKLTLSRISLIVIALVVVGALTFAFMPRPVSVDVQLVEKGSLRVTIDEDGRTRIRDRYVVSAPLTGRIERIQLRAGDSVEAGRTILTSIAPADPSLLDARAVAEAEARVRRAEVELKRAGPERERARAEYGHAENELARIRTAFERNAASRHELDAAELQHRVKMEAFNAAVFSEEIARFELDLARAALLRTRPNTGAADSVEHIDITAPVDGRVLRVFQESMAVVSPGAPLIEIGDPTDLEVEIDVLSTDAVRVRQGARVDFVHWGGDGTLEGRVRLVEPRAFTHISTLGVEEQRVYVIADFVDPPEKRRSLGDAFRVEARIVVWEDDAVVKTPTSALFRIHGDWTVFVVEDGRARRRTVQIGRLTGLEAQVLDGLQPGESVIVHPGDDVRDGVRIRIRR
ncbi:MAG: efflux RND transporter periplasmic adaptor subunit [Phycisphaeraceae bacterium]|nr:efflux RND transporter periplasmic adaptor subunit [Phycisphaeraceae bacterium]